MLNFELKNAIDKIFSLNSNLDDIKEGLDIKNSYCPRIIYKYRNLSSYSVENILNNNIWFDNPINMNDPYDCRFTYDNFANRTLIKPEEYKYIYANSPDEFDEELYNSIIKTPISLNEFFKRITIQGHPGDILVDIVRELHEDNLNRFVKFYLKNIYFCSFSKIKNSMLMWTHYSNNHTGFCIEYDSSNLFNGNPFINQLYPVIYTDKLFDVSQVIFKERNKISDKIFNNLYFNYPLIHKSCEWDYENEWRVIFSHGILKNPQNISTPPISKILLGKNFFKQFDIINNKKQELQDQLSLAVNLINHCKKNKIELEIMDLSHSNYSLINNQISYDDCYKLFPII